MWIQEMSNTGDLDLSRRRHVPLQTLSLFLYHQQIRDVRNWKTFSSQIQETRAGCFEESHLSEGEALDL